MKCNQSRPGFKIMSPCLFPTMITITWLAPFNLYRCGPYSPISHILSPHFTWLHFSHSDVSLVLPSLFVFNVKEWQCKYNIFYFYLLETLNHYSLWSKSGEIMRREEMVFLANWLNSFLLWSPDWNYPIRAVISNWPWV